MSVSIKIPTAITTGITMFSTFLSATFSESASNQYIKTVNATLDKALHLSMCVSCFIHYGQITVKKKKKKMGQLKSNHDTTKPTKWVCAQRRLRSAWASTQSDQCAQWVAKDPRFLHADSEDSDQTGQMPTLIWVLAGRTFTLLVLSCRGSSLLLIIWLSLIKTCVVLPHKKPHSNVWKL